MPIPKISAVALAGCTQAMRSRARNTARPGLVTGTQRHANEAAQVRVCVANSNAIHNNPRHVCVWRVQLRGLHGGSFDEA